MTRPAPRTDARRAATSEKGEPKLFAILVTFRRPKELAVMMSGLAEQTRQPDVLLVVDNGASAETEDIVGRHDLQAKVRYWAAPENLGPAGAIAAGMNFLIEDVAEEDDWILLLDDGNPPPSPTVLAELWEFRGKTMRTDERTAAVGMAGARLDWRRGLTRRPAGEELLGSVPVDVIGGGRLPMYRVGAIRDVGTYSGDFFFGFEELEFGLRLRRAGYSLHTDGSLWLRLMGRFKAASDAAYAAPGQRKGWRWYYGLRNLIYICRQHHRRWTALWVTFARGLALPLAYLVMSRMSPRDVALSLRACRDGWRGRLGRTIEPGQYHGAERVTTISPEG